ncbi:Gfo/Idh/MocA family oxidoreductase [Thiospirochaeta perfilievii]|uniref:Gfo/Idh/MocA family oxidoreductase n=1 Tax=Thiospirochaeta perfilievii TaxID=252967 RepID=A0A5C1QD42_9SPIO|nr:Gfo/Idh/MocA family oxidoreductase [Thiospirochaeta perfilievii]QEN04889.1 Gfo/Idh/MocA family oxidoreductase [Thiospirochaeta perfilievii]
MNVGIIGTGKIAEKLAEAINRVEGAVLYAVSSRSLDKARAFAEKFNVKLWFEGTDDFYKQESIDLVYIATPNSSHYSQTIEALDNNKAVLCEKPFALNSLESRQMFSKANEKNLLLVEAMWSKYFPAVDRVKAILDSGDLGTITHIHGDLSYPLDKSIERLYKKELGGGALLDLGIYPISMAHYFLGNPDSIQASSQFSESGVDTSTSIILSYKSGQTAVLTSSILAYSTNEFIISCSNGWIRLNGDFHHPKSISMFINGKGELHQEFPRDGYGYEYQVQGVIDDFNKGLAQGSVVKQKDTLEIMEILDRVRDLVGYNFND